MLYKKHKRRTSGVVAAAAMTVLILLTGCTTSGSTTLSSKSKATLIEADSAGNTSTPGRVGRLTTSNEAPPKASASNTTVVQVPSSTFTSRPVPVGSGTAPPGAVSIPPTASAAATPAFGAANLSPAQPIRITVSHGKMKDLSFTNASGKVIKGSISADHTRWTLGEVLGFGKVYTVAGHSIDAVGRIKPFRGTFTTVDTSQQADSYISPADNQAVGIAEPDHHTLPNSANRQSSRRAGSEYHNVTEGGGRLGLDSPRRRLGDRLATEELLAGKYQGSRAGPSLRYQICSRRLWFIRSVYQLYCWAFSGRLRRRQDLSDYCQAGLHHLR